jgi:tRNA-specific 2-thiouridylase
VLDELGRDIGVHDGAALYTIGQRHGFSIAGKASASPHYVVSIDAMANTITASPDKMRAARTTMKARNVHWIGEAPASPAKFYAQARYHEKEFPLTVVREGEGATLSFEEPHIASPGQSIVFYDGERCLGGAVISKTPSAVHSGANEQVKAVQ